MSRSQKQQMVFPPVEALRLIRRILADKSMGHAERIATAAVVLSADNETGEAWASYRSLRAEYGLSTDAIAGALRSDGRRAPRGRAIDRYLRIERRGEHGSVCYAALRTAERSGQQSDDPALRFPGSSAPVLTVQRSGQRRHTSPINLPHRLTPHSRARASKRRRPSSKWQNEDLEAVYNAYPRKVAKPKALAAIGKALDLIANRSGAPADPVSWLKGRVEAFAQSPAGLSGRFTPYPATWFNAGRYDDDAEEWNYSEESFNGNHRRSEAATREGQRTTGQVGGQRPASGGRDRERDHGEYDEPRAAIPTLG